MKKIFSTFVTVSLLSLFFTSCPHKTVNLPEPTVPEVPKVHTFTVKYEANLPGAFGSVDDQQHMSGFAIALRNADYKKLMYDFTGWYTEPGVDGSGAGDVFVAGKDAIVPNPDKLDVVTLYAGWKNRGGYNRAELQEIPIDPNTTKEQIIKFVDPNWKDQEGPTLEVIAADLEKVQGPITLDLREVAVEYLSQLFTNVDRAAFGDENNRYDAEGNVIIDRNDATPINIERVIIPKTLEAFGYNLFANCMALKEFVVPEENEWFRTNNATNGGKGVDGAGHILYQLNKKTSAGVTDPNPDRLTAVAVATSFSGELEFDSNTVLIGHQAAYGCLGLASVKWESLTKLETIGSYSFMKCKNLKSVDVPKSVKSIDGYAFSGCCGIESLTFADDSNLYRIGSRAFQVEVTEKDGTYKNGLTGKTINLPASLTKLGGQVFGNGYSNMTINFADSGSSTWYYFVTSEESRIESRFDFNGWFNEGKTGDEKIDMMIQGVDYTDGDGQPKQFRATEVTTDMTTAFKSFKVTLSVWNGKAYETKKCTLGNFIDCGWFRK